MWRYLVTIPAFLLLVFFYYNPLQISGLDLNAHHAESEETVLFNRVPVLLFHDIDGRGPYSVTRAEFRSYLQRLQDEGIEIIPLRTLLEHARENRPFENPSMVITVDDDFVNIVRIAAPMLREFRYPATFFVYTRGIASNPRFGMSWEDLQRLLDEGFDVQNHSYSHTVFHVRQEDETPEEHGAKIYREIVHSRNVLENNLPGHEIYAFAYPMGYYSDVVIRELNRQGYELLLTTDGLPVDVTREFSGSFDRFTIQKRPGIDMERLFDRQIGHARRPMPDQDVARSTGEDGF